MKIGLTDKRKNGVAAFAALKALTHKARLCYMLDFFAGSNYAWTPN
jgi:hypothetical protein